MADNESLPRCEKTLFHRFTSNRPSSHGVSCHFRCRNNDHVLGPLRERVPEHRRDLVHFTDSERTDHGRTRNHHMVSSRKQKLSSPYLTILIFNPKKKTP